MLKRGVSWTEHFAATVVNICPLFAALTSISTAAEWQHFRMNALVVFAIKANSDFNPYKKRKLWLNWTVFPIKSREVEDAGAVGFRGPSWTCCETEAFALYKVLKVEAKSLWCRGSDPDLTSAISHLVSCKLLLSNHTIYLLSKIILCNVDWEVWHNRCYLCFIFSDMIFSSTNKICSAASFWKRGCFVECSEYQGKKKAAVLSHLLSKFFALILDYSHHCWWREVAYPWVLSCLASSIAQLQADR